MAVTWEEETLTEASLVYIVSFRTSRTTQTHFLQAPSPTTKKGFIQFWVCVFSICKVLKMEPGTIIFYKYLKCG